ncbi:MAG TPA: YaiO family outer membrane beta-barrel protein, partial [Terriglobia bacterium]|nr:YaiO family outer membrane beta-barrel protein [Terriglobia bacterium]
MRTRFSNSRGRSRFRLAAAVGLALLAATPEARAQQVLVRTGSGHSAASAAALAKQTGRAEQIPLAGPAAAERPRGRIEVSQWGRRVSNGFGTWHGGGVHLFLDPAPRLSLLAEGFYEHRPGETEQAGAFGATFHLTPWFYAHLAISGGGPEDSTAFLPRYRYDLSGTLATPWPGFHLTGGWTRLEYGHPVSGRILRAGFLQYAGKVVLQGTVNFNNSRPGNHPSVDGVGSIQVGEEGRYWVGVVAGGGREAWQTQGLFPSNVEFDGYHLSVFVRRWMTGSFGAAFRYNYYIKRAAYHSNG